MLRKKVSGLDDVSDEDIIKTFSFVAANALKRRKEEEIKGMSLHHELYI